MIQRIQSLYLLLALALMVSIFFLPIAELLDSAEINYIYSYRGLMIEENGEMLYHSVPTIILLSVIVLISFVSIFLFKKRVLQMRINSFNIFIMIGYIGLNYYYIQNFQKQLDAIVSYELPMIFPLLAAILTYLAIRAIGKDEALIRSMDRIR